MAKKNIGVLLFGSGFLDGSEIRESVAALWALSQENVEVHIFAPNKMQYDVMDCAHRKPLVGEERNGFIEAARIARGKIKPLSECQPSLLDALILPGGFGVAKNLCTFAMDGSQGNVDAEVLAVLKEIKKQGKPIGAICISPALLGLAFKETPLELTLGLSGEAAEEVKKLGHKVFECQANECHIDQKNKIVTTPAYMIEDAPLHEVFEGIQKCIQKTLALCQ